MFPPTKLIDYFFVITARPSTTSTSTSTSSTSTGTTKKEYPWTHTDYFCYPPIPKDQDGGVALQNITPFCFPSHSSFSSSSTSVTVAPVVNTVHDFVLTDEMGKKRFASCWRTNQVQVVDKVVGGSLGGSGSGNENTTNTCQNGSVTAFCLVSNQPRFNSLRACLYEMEQRIHAKEQEDGLLVEDFVWQLLHRVLIPASGSVVTRVRMPSLAKMPQFPTNEPFLHLYSPPSRKSLPILDYSLLPMFRALSIRNVLRLFRMLLLEEKLLLCSRSLTLVTRSCETLLAFLFPLQWEMVYVPIVPQLLQDLLQAPTPFLMGGESVWVLKVCFPEDAAPPSAESTRPNNKGHGDTWWEEYDDQEAPVHVVDLDHDQIRIATLDSCATPSPSHLHHAQEYRERGPALPQHDRMLESLRGLFFPHLHQLDHDYPHVLQSEQYGALVHGSILDDHHYHQNQHSFDTHGMTAANMDEKIRNVFFDWFLASFAALPSYYRAEDGHFDVRKWVHSKPIESQSFFSAFAKTTMFEAFVEARSPAGKRMRTRDRFDELVAEQTPSCATTKSKLIPSIRILSTSHLDTPTTTTIEIDLSQTQSHGGRVSGNQPPPPTSAPNTFRLDLLQDFLSQNTHVTAFQTTLATLNAMLSSSDHHRLSRADRVDLHWTRAYCHEKIYQALLHATTTTTTTSTSTTALTTTNITSKEPTSGTTVSERQESLRCAFLDYVASYEGMVVEAALHYGKVEFLASKIKMIAGKLSKDVLDAYVQSLGGGGGGSGGIGKPATVEKVKALLQPLVEAKGATSTNLLPVSTTHISDKPSSAQPSRCGSQEPTLQPMADRMILNCDPDLLADETYPHHHAHIDSHDALDQDASKPHLSPDLVAYLEKPVELSIMLAEMITSMLKVISTPPATCGDTTGLFLSPKSVDGSSGKLVESSSRHSSPSRPGSATSGGDATAMETWNATSLNPFADFFRRASSTSPSKKTERERKTKGFLSKKTTATPSNTTAGSRHAAQDCFLLRDATLLARIKTMPSYEQFRRALVALRHLDHGDLYLRHLTTDHLRLAFWLNLRTVLVLHILVEFGAPSWSPTSPSSSTSLSKLSIPATKPTSNSAHETNPQLLAHRLGFLWNKLVYQVAGGFYSVHDVTYGILKAGQPLPSCFSPAVPVAVPVAVAPAREPGCSNMPGCSNVCMVHVTTSTVQTKEGALSPTLEVTTTTTHSSTTTPTTEPPTHSQDTTATTTTTTTSNTTTHTHTNQPQTIVTIPGTKQTISLHFATTDPRYQHRLQTPHPLLCFALIDGTSSSPLVCIYDPARVQQQLEHVAGEYVDRFVEVSKEVTVGRKEGAGGWMRGFATSSGGTTGTAGIQKRMVVRVPQFLQWYMRDLVSTSSPTIEQLAIQLGTLFPHTPLGKLQETATHNKGQSSGSGSGGIGKDKILVQTYEHVWDFELCFPCREHD